MKQKCLSVFAAIAASVFATACTKSSPTRPTETAASEAVSSILDAKSGVTLVSPQLISPAPGLRLKFAEQPVTLTVKNGVSTGSTPLTYTFQVASDAAFGSIVFSREGVAEGAGQTALTIDKLAGNKDYYWRARASAGSAVGLFSAIRTFNVGPEVVLQAPTVTAPTNGGQLSSQALLVVNNAQRTGPAGALTYRFEVSASSSFGNLAFVAPNVAEQGNQTSVRMDANLTTNGTYYLRVRASDNSNGITGPYSSTIQFKYVPFDLSQAIIVNSPPDLAVWPEGAKVTSINFTGDAFEVDFDRRDGPNRWPDMIPAGFEGALQYTLGMCVNNHNQWYCSGVVQFWYGRPLSDSTPPSYVGVNWFYDPVRWGPINYYQPQDGELVGLWVGAGNLRDGSNITRATCPAVCERSNIALVPWSNFGSVTYTFSSLGKILATKR
jgi:hypothetical protein